MTAAKFRSLAIAVIALSAAALGAGCNLEPGAADKPTYEADVRPIFMSRCIRCHGDPVLGDPTTTPYLTPPAGERLDVFADTNCGGDGGAGCVHGAAYMAMATTKKTTATNTARAGSPPVSQARATISAAMTPYTRAVSR